MMNMNNATTSRPTERPDHGRTAFPVEQLTLLPSDDISARFKISKETRERGLRHIAEIRQMLAERTGDQRRAA
jgi:hypothetical protein